MDSGAYFEKLSTTVTNLKLNRCQDTTAMTINWKNSFGEMAVSFPVPDSTDRMLADNLQTGSQFPDLIPDIPVT